MSPIPFRSSRWLVCAAMALAVVAAMGAATPRTRGAGRERVPRGGAIRLGSARVDGRSIWVAPDPSPIGVLDLGRPGPAATRRLADSRGPVVAAVDSVGNAPPGPGGGVAVPGAATRVPVSSPASTPQGRAPPLA